MEVPAHLPVGSPSAPLALRTLSKEMCSSLDHAVPSPPSLTPAQHAALSARCSVTDVQSAIHDVAQDREVAVALRKRWDEWALHDPAREAKVASEKAAPARRRPRQSRQATSDPQHHGDDDDDDDEYDQEKAGEVPPSPKKLLPTRPRETKRARMGKPKPTMARAQTKFSASVLAPSQGEGSSSIKPWPDRLEELDAALPPAFRFHQQTDLMGRHCQREPREGKNALQMPVDVRNVLTERPGNLDFMRSRPGDDDLLRALPSSSAATDETSQAPPPLILRISVFSRRSLGISAGGLSKITVAVAKEHDPADNARDPKTPASDGEGNDAKEEEEGDESGEGYGRGHKATLYGRVSLSQTLEIRSDATLLDLRNAIVCRMDDLAERVDGGAHLTTGGGQGDAQMRFTGRKRSTDSAMLIEDVVYSEMKDGQDGRYAEFIAEYLASGEKGKVVQGDVQACPRSMSEVRLEELDEIRAGRPYWFLHQGSCEHLWAVQSVRLPHRTDVRLPHGTAPATYGFPLSLHLSTGHLQRLVVKSARLGSKSEVYALDRCEACKAAPTRLLVVGGERARLGEMSRLLNLDDQDEEEDEGEGEGEMRRRKEMLQGLPALVTGLCHACWEHMTGLPKLIGHEDTELGEQGAISQEEEEEEGDQRDEGQGASKRHKTEDKAKSRRMASSADASRTTWARAGGKGWTVVPVLD